MIDLLGKRCRIIGLAIHPDTLDAIRQHGGLPLAATEASSAGFAHRRRLASWATHILHSAPPAGTGDSDPLTQDWLRQLAAARPRHRPSARKRRHGIRAGHGRGAGVVIGLGQGPRRHARTTLPGALPRRLVYLSTTGIYGNRNGQWVSEADQPRPQTERARRRVAAERLIRDANRRLPHRLATLILRVPGIYGANRLPLERLRQQIPALVPEDDVITNHIHADDLARIATIGLLRGPHQRIINVIDNSQLYLGEYLDLVADHLHMQRPPRFSRAELSRQLSPIRMSFMSESRRIRNQRLKKELRVKLRYPTVADFLVG